MRKFVIILLHCFFLALWGQNEKDLLKSALQHTENGLYELAIQDLTKAIQINPKFDDLYTQRANCYLQLGDTISAAYDYTVLAQMKDDEEYFNTAANIYYNIGEYDKALIMANKSIDRKQKSYIPWLIKTKIYLNKNDIDKASIAINEALKDKELAQLLYLRAYIYYLQDSYSVAESYLERTIMKDDNYVEAYLLLAEIQIYGLDFERAKQNCDFVLRMDKTNVKANYLRAQANDGLHEPKAAINDISRAISLNGKAKFFLLRGELNYKYGNFREAINDYSVLLNNESNNTNALKNRAAAYERLGKIKEASADYKNLANILDKTGEEPDLLAYSKKRIYDINRENNKPGIYISSPEVTEKSELPFLDTQSELIIEGYILDENVISGITINGAAIDYDSDSLGHASFSYSINPADVEFITITAQDIYNNSETNAFLLNKTEKDAPVVNLLSPFVTTNNTIIIDNNDNSLYIEGNIADKSLIQHIQINEMSASFSTNTINPRFTAIVDLSNQNTLTVSATDVLGNTSLQTYTLQRDAALNINGNPMGKTWAVLIENSVYDNYSNLKSPEKEMSLLKESFGNYQISNVLHKKDLSKSEMERFFAIELRDLVKKNNVNSLLIWYAGHGTYLNETGYWIPKDATVDEEFDFYNLNALKASLYSYRSLTHLLVISDACEAGESFTIALRGEYQTPSCTNANLLSSRSRQVFTSTTEGYALDNSNFSSSFANTLNSNERSCISVDEIANSVSSEVFQMNAQRPVFGKIAGLKDENGTFFFIRK